MHKNPLHKLPLRLALAKNMTKLPSARLRKIENRDLKIASLLVGLFSYAPTVMLIKKLVIFKFPHWANTLRSNYEVLGSIFVDIIFLSMPIILLNAFVTFAWFKLFSKPSGLGKLLYLLGCLFPVFVIDVMVALSEHGNVYSRWPHVIFVTYSPVIGASIVMLKMK